MVAKVELNSNGLALSGDIAIGLSSTKMSEIRLTRNDHAKSLPRYELSYHALRCWISEEDGQKLIDAGVELRTLNY
jgi:hypothetical protein